MAGHYTFLCNARRPMDTEKTYEQKGRTLQLINFTCDPTQFVISIIVKDALSENLAKLFI